MFHRTIRVLTALLFVTAILVSTSIAGELPWYKRIWRRSDKKVEPVKIYRPQKEEPLSLEKKFDRYQGALDEDRGSEDDDEEDSEKGEKVGWESLLPPENALVPDIPSVPVSETVPRLLAPVPPHINQAPELPIKRSLVPPSLPHIPRAPRTPQKARSPPAASS